MILAAGAAGAAGRPVAAIDSIESGHGWGRKNLVDGFFSESSFELAADRKGEAVADAKSFFARIIAASAAQTRLTELQAERQRLREAAIPC